jgi:Heterokaryon incompatibility protein (HET)/Zinc finger, C2H2 type
VLLSVKPPRPVRPRRIIRDTPHLQTHSLLALDNSVDDEMNMDDKTIYHHTYRKWNGADSESLRRTYTACHFCGTDWRHSTGTELKCDNCIALRLEMLLKPHHLNNREPEELDATHEIDAGSQKAVGPGGKDSKKRRFSDFLGADESEISANVSAGILREGKPPLPTLEAILRPPTYPGNIYSTVPSSIQNNIASYGPEKESDPRPADYERRTRRSYSDSHPQLGSSATTPIYPSSPKSFGSRNSSPPRAASVDFARGHITPPIVPFRDDSPFEDRFPTLKTFNRRESYPSGSGALVEGYKYQSIREDQVRLLVLHAGDFDTTIHCSLKVMPVNELSKSRLGYYALSYAWGDEVLEHILLQDVQDCAEDSILGQNHRLPKDFYVRSNLHAALKRLRCEDKDVWFWIDAICINQADKVEKSHQLPKMLEIYGNAFSVCVWLGEAEPLKRSDEADHDPFDLVSTIVNLKLLDFVINGQAGDMVHYFVAFANLLKRPWFRRRWVIQEVSAATTAFVQCGDKKVNWIDFSDTVQLFLLNIERIRTIYNTSELSKRKPNALGHVESVGAGAIVRAASSVLRKSEEGNIVARLWDIESLVVTFLHFEATDTRDTIYALLALASDSDQYKHFAVSNKLREQDYTKSTVLVYVEFVQHCVKSANSLDIICRHWALPPKDQDKSKLTMPSWIGIATDAPFGPSSRAIGRLNGDNLVGKPGHKIYNASRGRHPMVEFHVHNAQDDYYPSVISLSDPLPRAKRHKCPHCSTTFTRHHNLKSHLLTHSQEKPYECHHCSSRFRRLHDLKRHSKLHQNLRISVCSHCGRKFAREDALKRHTKGDTCAGRQLSFSDEEQNDIDGTSDNLNQNPATDQPEHITRSNNTNASESMDSVTLSSAVGQSSDSNSNIHGHNYHIMDDRSQSQGEVTESVVTPGRYMTPNSLSQGASGTEGVIDSGHEERNDLNKPSLSLSASGFRLCRINKISSRVVDGIISHDGLEIAGWNRHRDLTHIPDRLWRTLVADRADNGSVAPSWWRRACMHCLSRASPDGDLNTTRLIENGHFPETVMEYLRRIQAVVWNRKFFECQDSSNSGSLITGLGSRHIQEGDWCCILFGCSVPVILREEPNNSFKFVGECYIYGMMDGEALTMLHEKSYPTEQFLIR